MKKIISIITILSSLFILTACSTDNNDNVLVEEQVEKNGLTHKIKITNDDEYLNFYTEIENTSNEKITISYQERIAQFQIGSVKYPSGILSDIKEVTLKPGDKISEHTFKSNSLDNSDKSSKGVFIYQINKSLYQVDVPFEKVFPKFN